MDPLTLALLAGGATAIGNIPSMRKTELEREQERRLKALQRQQELGSLGLTEQEQAQISERYSGMQDQARAQQEALLGQYSTMQGQPGQTALQQVAAGEQAARIASEQAQAIAAADLQAKQEQEAELLDLQAALSEQKRTRQEAVLEPVVSGAEAYIKGQTLQSLAGLAKTGTEKEREAVISKYKKMFDLTDTESRELFDALDIEDMKYLGL
jgi:hypothetical protein